MAEFQSPGEHLKNGDALAAPSGSLKLVVGGGAGAAITLKALQSTLMCSQVCKRRLPQSSHFRGKKLRPDWGRNFLGSQSKLVTERK